MPDAADAELLFGMRDYEFGDAADGIMEEDDGDASLDLAAELEKIMVEEALAPEVEPAGLAEPVAADDADRILAHWMPRFLAAVDALRSCGEAMAKHPEPESTGQLSLVLTSEGTTQFVCWVDAKSRLGRQVRLETAPCTGRVIYSTPAMCPVLDFHLRNSYPCKGRSWHAGSQAGGTGVNAIQQQETEVHG